MRSMKEHSRYNPAAISHAQMHVPGCLWSGYLALTFRRLQTKELYSLLHMYMYGAPIHTEKGGNLLSDIRLIRQELRRRNSQLN
jgi:hypothetical protein